jgi:hypothetical protein
MFLFPFHHIVQLNYWAYYSRSVVDIYVYKKFWYSKKISSGGVTLRRSGGHSSQGVIRGTKPNLMCNITWLPACLHLPHQTPSLPAINTHFSLHSTIIIADNILPKDQRIHLTVACKHTFHYRSTASIAFQFDVPKSILQHRLNGRQSQVLYYASTQRLKSEEEANIII